MEHLVHEPTSPGALGQPMPTDAKALTSASRAIIHSHVGRFAWGAVLFEVAVHFVYIASTILAVRGLIPLWLGFVINSIAAYYSFAPLHEAMHGNISGKGVTDDRTSFFDTAFGWIFSFLVITPFSAYRALHLKHHKYTNHPELDPDFYVKADTWWKSMLSCIRARIIYIITLKRHGQLPKVITPAIKNAIIVSAIMNYGSLLIVAGFSFIGYFSEVFFLWYLPSKVAILFLELIIAYLPHHPHEARRRFQNTRINTFWGSSILLMGHDHHAIHHLFPRVPFYYQPKIFRLIREDLERNQLPVIRFSLSSGGKPK